jgi:hypothetical protein
MVFPIIDSSRAADDTITDSSYVVIFVFLFADNETNEQYFGRKALQHADEIDILRTFRRGRGPSEDCSNAGEVK